MSLTLIKLLVLQQPPVYDFLVGIHSCTNR